MTSRMKWHDWQREDNRNARIDTSHAVAESLADEDAQRVRVASRYRDDEPRTDTYFDELRFEEMYRRDS